MGFSKGQVARDTLQGSSGPTWAALAPGVSEASICPNPECESRKPPYKGLVTVNFGFGKFLLAEKEDKLACPLCKTKLEHDRLICYHCEWTLEIRNKQQGREEQHGTCPADNSFTVVHYAPKKQSTESGAGAPPELIVFVEAKKLE